jgi:hypothetical protein
MTPERKMMGSDHDEDGIYDRNEIANGVDPLAS